MATATVKSEVRDAVLAQAVELARAGAVEVADRPEYVGEYLGAELEAERLVSHRFACAMPGYSGWAWTVTLARVPRGRVATICEVELLPGPDSILAPAWVPWSERLQPGDLGANDILPFRPDDPRLEPGYTPTGDEQEDFVAIEELALARARVISQTGLREAAQRWYRTQGPARYSAGTPGNCSGCGFLIPLQGSLGQLFGVCVNEWSNDDGRVVSFDHSCGAHSETDVKSSPSAWPAPQATAEVFDVEILEPKPEEGEEIAESDGN